MDDNIAWSSIVDRQVYFNTRRAVSALIIRTRSSLKKQKSSRLFFKGLLQRRERGKREEPAFAEVAEKRRPL
jgi:hypothetical protein